ANHAARRDAARSQRDRERAAETASASDRRKEHTMRPHHELTREIDDSPADPHIAAFFDLDRTLIAGFSAITFVRDGFRSGRLGTSDLIELLFAAASFQLGTVGFSGFLTGTARTLRGFSEAEFAAVGQQIFNEELAADVYPEARAIVNAHRQRRHTV